MEIYLAVLSLAITMIAAYTDLRSRTIPNVLTLIGIPAALLILFWGRDVLEVQSYLISGGVSLVMMLLAFYTRVFGGGDAKILIFLGFCVSLESLVWLWFYISLVGGVEALIYILAKQKKKQTIPYGVAIFGGTVLFWLDFWL